MNKTNKDNPFSGKLITLEGIEGTGKSTNLEFIANWIKGHGKEVVLTREPGGTPVAESIRDVLLQDYSEKVCPETEILLFYAARVQHVKTLMKPALEKGQWVLSDRFYDASFAYQGAGRDISLERLQALHDWALGDFAPDLTLYLDAPVAVGLERIKARGEPDRLEKEKVDFFERVRQAYLQLAKKMPERIQIVDAAQPLEKVQKDIAAILDKRYNKGRQS